MFFQFYLELNLIYLTQCVQLCTNQGRTQKFLKRGGGVNFSKSNQYSIVVNLVIVKQGFAVIVASLQHLLIQKPCITDFESCWLRRLRAR